MNDTGESSKAINASYDELAWPNIQAGLQAGGRLRIHHKIDRAVLEGLAENHPNMQRMKTVTKSFAKRLHREGVLVQTCVDTYGLAPFKLTPEQSK